MATLQLLPHGPLTPRTVHLCIDMQRLFFEETPWRTPWMERILSPVAAIAERHPDRTIFTRFVPPRDADRARGTWRQYFERWRSLTRRHLDPSLLDLMPRLNALVPPAMVFDKGVYSAFFDRRLAAELARNEVDSVVITGVETDVCVLSTVMSAIDIGFRVVLPRDAMCSSSDATHDALMTLYTQRFAEQIEVASTEAVLSSWL